MPARRRCVQLLRCYKADPVAQRKIEQRLGSIREAFQVRDLGLGDDMTLQTCANLDRKP
jgi:hypothetical protein